jgi:UDP-glucose 4-epimerase
MDISVNSEDMKTYLITGGSGFIGSHLAEKLLKMGYRVICIDDLSTGKKENISHLSHYPNFSFVRSDIMDSIVLDRLVSQSDIIIHLAAAVGVQLIVNNPVRTIETNVKGTEVVLKSALRYDCKVMLSSTSEVYGKSNKLPFSEDDDSIIGPTSKSRWCYAISKMLDESLALAYHREYGLDVIPFRLFNTIGPKQTGQYGMVVPRFINQALKNEPITVYGDGRQKRCFCDVRDVIEAIVGLSNHPKAVGKIFNVGSTEEISINTLAEKVRQITKSSSEVIHIPYDIAYAPGFEDMEQRIPDTSLIRSLIGWRPQYTLEETLREIMQSNCL